jgi:hypothetical protein
MGTVELPLNTFMLIKKDPSKKQKTKNQLKLKNVILGAIVHTVKKIVLLSTFSNIILHVEG